MLTLSSVVVNSSEPLVNLIRGEVRFHLCQSLITFTILNVCVCVRCGPYCSFHIGREKTMNPKEARIQLATTFRALAFYGLNEGVDNHVTVRCKVVLGSPRPIRVFFRL